ncbi:MAG: hypothetical protein IJ861_09465 [Clostridia bacterium]|nr:hypothetical protein [Clostridia bacterium]
MDLALTDNGTLKEDFECRPYLIDGIDEVLQKVYIILSAKKGRFIYDRELGSNLYQIDMEAEDAEEGMESEARNALRDTPFVEVKKAEIRNGKAYIIIEIDDQEYEIPVRRESNGLQL